MRLPDNISLFYNTLSQHRYGLAPMAGVTDVAFRAICKGFGCGLTYTEMVSAKGLHYGGERTARLLEAHPSEGPFGIQLFGSEPALLADTVKRLQDEAVGITLFDINMGCPAPKITGNGEGSALMKDIPLAARIVEAMALASELPVTVKFRAGWDGRSVNAVEFARAMEQSGAAGVCVHGRTRMQFYSGKADWGIIAEVKAAVDIPVLGNGDVFSARDALVMREATGCDGVLVARGAQGNPWIFREIAHLEATGEPLPPPSGIERLDMALKHAKDLAELRGEHAAVEMRKHIAWYVKGLPGASAFRERVNHTVGLRALEEEALRYRERVLRISS